MSSLPGAVSGVLGGLCAVSVMHPIDVAQKRIQVQDRKMSRPYSSLLDAVFRLSAKNGVASLYDGLLLAYFTSIVKNSVFFSCYESLKIAFPSVSPVGQIVFGAVSGSVTTLFLLPLQVVQTLQSVHSNRGARMSALDALREVLQERGVGGLFAGLTPSLVLSVYPALQHAIFDNLKKWYLRKHKETQELPSWWAFVFGLAANLTALSLVYPLIYIKVRVQAQKVKKEHHLGAIEMGRKIVARDGFVGLWQGMQSQMMNACFSSAILFSTKERIQSMVNKMMKKGV